MDQSCPVDHPDQAWLAPIAGYAYLILLGIFATLMSSVYPSRAMLMVFDLLQLLGFLVFLVFGYTKSIQCLIGKGNVKHGIVGLIVNTLSVLFFALLIILRLGVFAAAR